MHFGDYGAEIVMVEPFEMKNTPQIIDNIQQLT